MPYDFEVDYEPVPASLLELEFGRAYAVRARVADLAGGGLQLRDRPVGGPTKLETYVRYEPLPPPRLVPPAGLMVLDDSAAGGFRIDSSVVGPGGSNERLVIRSEPDGDGFSTASFDSDPAYPDNNPRRFEAPLTTFALAEQHGVLRLSDETGAELASRAFVGGQAGEVSPAGLEAAQLSDPAALGMAVAVLTQPGLLDDEKSDDRPWEGAWPRRVAKDLELAPGGPQSEPRVDWRDRGQPRLTRPRGFSSGPGCAPARLPGGGRGLLHVLGDWIGRFALNRFLSEPLPDEDDDEDLDVDANQAQNAMVRGRHPLLSPTRWLLLTHAVRRPLDPAHGSALARRDAGETVARIAPTDDEPVWGIHVASTGSVDVCASWQEWGDAPEPMAASAVVAQVNLPRGTARLPELTMTSATPSTAWSPSGDGGQPFRDCFVDDDPTSSGCAGELDVVSVKSTARPLQPVVVSVVPAFPGRRTRRRHVTRRRLGGRLRVELARPWFTTGEGEGLAVLVWPGAEEPPPRAVREPGHLVQPRPHPRHGRPACACRGEQLAGFRPPSTSRSSPGGPAVRALVYPVFIHDGHWYADVELPGVVRESYSPLVRLAVARFQADSLRRHGPGPADVRGGHRRTLPGAARPAPRPRRGAGGSTSSCTG